MSGLQSCLSSRLFCYFKTFKFGTVGDGISNPTTHQGKL